jgi:integrase
MMGCGDTRRWPRWSQDDAVQRGLESFADHMIDHGRAPVTTLRYLPHVARGWADPLGYLRTIHTWQGMQHAKHALCAYADYRRQGHLKPSIMGVPDPLKPARLPVHVPRLSVWRAMGTQLLREHPAELGHVLWILLYSGLRIGDVLGLTRAQVSTASTGATVEMRHKGRGGRRKRTFRPIDDVLPALRWLAASPGWGVLWQAVGRNKKCAEATIRKCLPDPYSPHDFRRAFATYLYARTKNLLLIAQMGGWESVASVERYITIVPEEDLEAARNDLSNLLFPKDKPPDPPPPRPVRPPPPRRR